MEDETVHCFRRPARRSAAGTIAVVVALSLAGAATSLADDEMWRAIFRGTTEVNVVNLDVIVTDGDGRPVKGLQKQDFVLEEAGQAVEITNFFAIEDGRAVLLTDDSPAAGGATESSPESATVEPEPAHLILYVDNANITEINRARVFERVREFLLSHRKFNAKVMLVSNDRSLVVRQDFTSVPHEIFVALQELERTGAVSPRFAADRRQIIRAIEDVNVEAGSDLFSTKALGETVGPGGAGPTSIGRDSQKDLTARAIAEARPILELIRTYSAQRFQHTRDTLRTLRQLTDTVAGLPGRKSILYVSEGLPLRPGEALFEAYAQRFQYLSDLGGNIHPEMESLRDDAAPEFTDLVEHANASRVTFYTIDASANHFTQRGSAESGGYSGGNFANWNDSMTSTDQRNAQDSLVMMAEDTGGRYGLSHTTYDAVLQGVVADFENYYSLGFVADRVPDGEQRSLKVRVDGKGYNVRYRRSFRDKPAAERTSERVQAALLLDGLENPFEITLESAEHQAQDDGTFIVPLAVRIPLGKLVLLPGETEHRGNVSMFVAVRDEKGRTSEVNRHICPIRIPNPQVLTALGQSASCGVRLLMRRGPQRVAVSVLDEVTSVDSTVHLLLDVGAAAQQANQQARLDNAQ